MKRQTRMGRPPTNPHPRSGIARAIAAAGGVQELADLLKLTNQAVNRWKFDGKPPADRVLEIEAATGVSRHELRPDIYPRDGGYGRECRT